MLNDNSTCKVLCTTTIPAADGKFVNERISEGYAFNWLIDGLPAAEKKMDTKTKDTFYDIGFELGSTDLQIYEKPALNNHYDIVLR